MTRALGGPVPGHVQSEGIYLHRVALRIWRIMHHCRDLLPRRSPADRCFPAARAVLAPLRWLGCWASEPKATVWHAPELPQFPARAKNVIFLYMDGGPSQVDTFDYKPMLEKYNGQDPHKAMGKLEPTQFANIGKVMASPWKFRQYGRGGTWVSDLFPHVAQVVDELAIIRSMTSEFSEHTNANYFLHTGSGLQGRPSMGAWTNYGLGSTP